MAWQKGLVGATIRPAELLIRINVALAQDRKATSAILIAENELAMKSLPIVWQRLVSPEGKTCDRCSATHQEIQRALGKLEEALHPLGIAPSLDVREIDEKAFKANPSESNRIWIAGKPMEEWLGASVGSSRCC